MFRSLYSAIAAVFLLFMLSNCAGSRAVGTEGSPEEGILRVMTYNIHHANPPSQPDSIDIGAIVKAIASQNPDLVALQEVDADTRRSGIGNQAEMIAEKLGMHVFFGKALDFDGGEYGTAILSRYPLFQPRVHKLPDLGGKGAEQRILTTARIEIPNGPVVIFGSTHLDHRGNPESRLLQMREILEISAKEKLPMIVAGDLNARPGSEEMKLLETKFSTTCTDCPNSFPAEGPDRAIDYIAYYDTSEELETVSHIVVEEAYASDHRPVLAELRFR